MKQSRHIFLRINFIAHHGAYISLRARLVRCNRSCNVIAITQEYLYLVSFSLLLFIFLIRFSLSHLSLSCSLSHQVLSLSSFSLRPLKSSSSSWLWRYSLSHLSLYGRGGPLSLLFRLASVFNLYSTDFLFPRFSICTVLFFSPI